MSVFVPRYNPEVHSTFLIIKVLYGMVFSLMESGKWKWNKQMESQSPALHSALCISTCSSSTSPMEASSVSLLWTPAAYTICVPHFAERLLTLIIIITTIITTKLQYCNYCNNYDNYNNNHHLPRYFNFFSTLLKGLEGRFVPYVSPPSSSGPSSQKV